MRFRVRHIFIATILSFAADNALAACTANLRDGQLNLRNGPSQSAETVALIPGGSCRIAVETAACQGKWCRASHNGKFGWVNTDFVTGTKEGSNHTFNYFILRAVYDVVGKRANRGYDLSMSYSEDMRYPEPPTGGVKRFYHRDNDWVFPGDKGKTMCVAAVAEVIVEALNLYVSETADASVARRLPAEHWGARAQRRHIRQHIWEYDGLGSRGAGHALARFDIGVEKTFSTLVPGDTLKINRTGAPGHSTIFIAYLDSSGAMLEQYSEKARGFFYFSAHGGGRDLDGNPSTGLGFKREYFEGSCPADERPERCRVISSGKWGPNLGRMFHPKSWGDDVGAKYSNEFARELLEKKTGKPVIGVPMVVLNSGEAAGVRLELEALLSREMDPKYVGYFDKGD